MNHSNQFQTQENPINLEQAVGEFERTLILQALEKCNGVQTQAAQHLGTTRRILRYRMEKLGIQPHRGKHL